MSGFKATEKQLEIMTLVVEAAARGQKITISDLMNQLSYKPARAATHCSIKFLRKHGFVERVNRGCNGAEIIPTTAGMLTFKSRPGFP